MSRAVRATFRSTSWEELPVGDGDALPRLTRASCRQTYTGDVQGSSELEYLMVYRDDGAATFVGVERVEGSVCGERGSFALQHVGVFESGVARMSLTVVPGSGTGALRRLAGTGRFESPHAPEYAVTLECTFD